MEGSPQKEERDRERLNESRSSALDRTGEGDTNRSSMPGDMSRSSMASSRASARSLKPPSVVVCDSADLQGPITFGDGCIVHPGAYIDARGGKITFGENCIIEEKARIVNKVRKDAQGKAVVKEMHIGSYNLFEAGCTISTSEIGDYNEFCHKSFVEDNCRIGNMCVVGPRVTLPFKTELTNNIVAYEDSRTMMNDESVTPEIKKPKMKELCQILAVQLFKHNKMRKEAGAATNTSTVSAASAQSTTK